MNTMTPIARDLAQVPQLADLSPARFAKVVDACGVVSLNRQARLLAPEPPRWNRLLDELVAAGSLYVFSYEDFVDRFGLPLGVKTDAVSGERTAYHATGGWPLDTPLCGGCDGKVSRGGYCIRCDEDHAANLSGIPTSKIMGEL